MSEILVVDDDLDMRRLLGTVLRGKGYEVALAKSYGWGILMGKLNLPNIVIADVQLGAMYDGVQLAQTLVRQNPHSQSIIMTAAPTEELRRRTSDTGFRLIEKPIRSDQLCLEVEEAFRDLELNEQMC